MESLLCFDLIYLFIFTGLARVGIEPEPRGPSMAAPTPKQLHAYLGNPIPPQAAIDTTYMPKNALMAIWCRLGA